MAVVSLEKKSTEQKEIPKGSCWKSKYGGTMFMIIDDQTGVMVHRHGWTSFDLSSSSSSFAREFEELTSVTTQEFTALLKEAQRYLLTLTQNL